jgi:hypothetical protein
LSLTPRREAAGGQEGAVREAGPEVIVGEVGVVGEDLVVGHAVGQEAEDEPDPDAGPPDDGLAERHLRVDGDAVEELVAGHADPAYGGLERPTGGFGKEPVTDRRRPGLTSMSRSRCGPIRGLNRFLGLETFTSEIRNRL